jgi:hypothetical protein
VRVSRLAAAAVLGALAHLLGSVGVAREARADDQTGVLASHHEIHYESPQRFAFELRFSPYHPTVDDDGALHGLHPYADAFGPNPRLEFAAELDYQVLRIPHVGTIGPGLSVGYVSASRPAKLVTPQPDGNDISAENTSLQIIPFYLVVVFRADVVTRELHIPFVPYFKAGLGYALWRAYNDAGTSVVQTPNGPVEGKGHTVGTQVAIGLSFDLNVIDQTAAHNFDNALGVNHTYLFAEAYVSQFTGLGQSNALYVGNGSFTGGGAGPAGPAWAFGLAVEF